MSAPTAAYALVATTIAQLKAITATNRSPNFCILIPEIGSWVYYSSTSTATANDVHCFAPNDGVGRWLVTNQLPYFAAANSAIASHVSASNPHSQYSTAEQVGNVANAAAASAASSTIASHISASNPHSQYASTGQVTDVAASAASSVIASHVSASNPHTQYSTAEQVGTVANAAANGAITTHVLETNPHSQYHRRDGVLIAEQPNSTTPAYAAKVATGAGSSSGGYQVHTPGGGVAASIGADSSGRGVIKPGTSGLVIGETSSEPLSFWGKTPVVRPNAIALPGNNTTDMRRAINDLINASRAIGTLP